MLFRSCLENLPEIPGRMQRLGGAGKPLVVVDYAHTPDALDKVAQALRRLRQSFGANIQLYSQGHLTRDAPDALFRRSLAQRRLNCLSVDRALAAPDPPAQPA